MKGPHQASLSWATVVPRDPAVADGTAPIQEVSIVNLQSDVRSAKVLPAPKSKANGTELTLAHALERIRELESALTESSRIRYRVSEKSGALSVYGLHKRYPVTLYKSQWERLIADLDNLKAALNLPGLK